MNNVTTSKVYTGVYNLTVTTEAGEKYTVKLENVKDQIETSRGYVWHIQEATGVVDFVCGAYHQTKREAIQFLKYAPEYTWG